MPKLAPDHLLYIDKLWRRLREANLKTMELDRTWHQLNDALNDMLDREGTTDPVQRDRVKAQSIALSDALGGGKWWREKAVWLAQAILAEKAAIEMTQGSGEWEKASW